MDTPLHAPGDEVLQLSGTDVGRHGREALRRRLSWAAVAVWLLVIAEELRVAADPVHPFAPPHVDWLTVTPILFFVLLVAVMAGSQVLSGRSPHVTYRPEQIGIRLSDVVGIDGVREEVVRSLNLFLAHERFAGGMGGRPRRGLLFEGPPGTGKTHTAKAMATEAGVPFLFASASSFQSSFYGATARKVRSYFRELRRAARRHGGAIGFIDEFDAIAGVRQGLEFAPAPAVFGCGGLDGLPSLARSSAAPPAGGLRTEFGTSDLAGPVVNELLVQLQSFDEPTAGDKLRNRLTEALNGLLPPRWQLPAATSRPANILLIASTNRADGLDPALLRPGRLDRRLSFDPPGRPGRRALFDHFLAAKAHEPALDDADQRNALAALTTGYTPAMIEGLLDEALVFAVRRGAAAMDRRDIEAARLTLEIGLANPTAYTDHERRLVATHEAGHAVVAHLVAPHRRLELLSIVKRRGSLGLLAHGDVDDVYTRSAAELRGLIRIAMGGSCAEELFFGDTSTGPGGDLAYATGVAAEMVGSCGMAGSLVSYNAVRGSSFTDSGLVGRVLGDGAGRAAVEDLLAAQRAEALALLDGNQDLVAALRDALLDRDELVGAEIGALLDAAVAARPTRVVDLTATGPAAVIVEG